MMQKERVEIIATQMIRRNEKTVFIVPHEDQGSTVNDIVGLFGKYMIDNIETEFPVLTAAFNVLKNKRDEKLFVFMKRNKNEVFGILRSSKVLYSHEELKLLQLTGSLSPYNYPLFTFKETNAHFENAMEQICIERGVNGLCFAIFCYK
tara:strand:- start:1022 stop:1468 length:447 start_codon:yes stop_codon:yes gene_type:complete